MTGPQFNTLHLMFEQQYGELALALDQIAQRIRALGFPAPASYAEYTQLSSLTEDQDRPGANEMIARLAHTHETLTRTARSLLPNTQQGRDQATADLLTQRLQIHEKTAWTLRSMLEAP